MTAAAKAAITVSPKLFTRPCTIRMPRFITDCWTQVRMEKLAISRILARRTGRSWRRGRSWGQRIRANAPSPMPETYWEMTVASAAPEADVSVQRSLLTKCSALLSSASKALEELKALLPQVDSMTDVAAMAAAYRTRIVPAMAALRHPVDELELLVDKDIWPVHTYGDLMFEV